MKLFDHCQGHVMNACVHWNGLQEMFVLLIPEAQDQSGRVRGIRLQDRIFCGHPQTYDVWCV